MRIYLKEVKSLVEGFTSLKINVIPREANAEANAVSKYTWQTMPFHIHFIECVACPRAYECFDIQNTTD